MNPRALLFAKRDNGWAGIAGEESHGFMGVYTAPEEGRAVLFTMWAVEGPGREYTIMMTQDGFANLSCSTLEFPDEIKSTTDFMSVVDFNVGEQGHGALIGSAGLTLEDGTTGPTHWYRYQTADGGKTWSAPEVLTEKPAELSGIYAPADEGGFCDLKSDLVGPLR